MSEHVYLNNNNNTISSLHNTMLKAIAPAPLEQRKKKLYFHFYLLLLYKKIKIKRLSSNYKFTIDKVINCCFLVKMF